MKEIDQILLYKMLCDFDEFYLDRDVYGYYSDDKSEIIIASWIPSSLESICSESIDSIKYYRMLSKLRNNKFNSIK